MNRPWRYLLLLTAQIWQVAAAHHSAVMFDTEAPLLLTGTVREFQFTNPHCFIQLLVPGPRGTVEWSVEMGAPLHLLRHGWSPRLLQPGDKIAVRIFPLKDGGHGGSFVSGTRGDGQPLGTP